MEEKILKAQQIIKSLYLNRDGKPFEATPGQAEIYAAMAMSPELIRVYIAACTQYGKSEIASQAILSLAVASKQRIAIVAPSMDQGRIIMGGVITHIFDNPAIEAMVDFDGNKDRFKRERSKSRVDFRGAGSVMVITANASGLAKQGKGLMGFGAEVVVVEESSLIPDPMFAKILRMVGGVKNGKLIQIGNTWERNHFYRASKNEKYHNTTINYEQALREDRYSKEFIEEARATIDPIDWTVFYECKFPDNISDALIPLSDIEAAVPRKLPDGPKHLGCDVARFGGDKTVAVLRAGPNVKFMEDHSELDTMKVAGLFKNLINEHKPEAVNIDVIGVGAGVVDRLIELKYDVNGVNVAEKSIDTEKFGNLRAEIFWGLRRRFMEGDICIPNDLELIRQLSEIRYNYNSRGQIMIESKQSMRKRGVKSPDKADALALAFYSNAVKSNISFAFG